MSAGDDFEITTWGCLADTYVDTLEMRCQIQRDAIERWKRERDAAEKHIEQHRRALSRLLGDLERAEQQRVSPSHDKGEA